MIRRIHCENCDRSTRPQHPDDVAMGWKRRRTEIRTKKPENHSIAIIATTDPGKPNGYTSIPLSSIVCDGCNTELPDGSMAFALTEWQDWRESEPRPWENDYSQPN